MSDSTCSVADCGKASWQRGWCTTHYQRWRRHGDVHYQPAAREVTQSRSGRLLRCNTCKQMKIETDFSARPQYSTGREGSCRSCVRVRRSEALAADAAKRERARRLNTERKQKSRAADPVPNRLAARRHYAVHREAIIAARREWRAEHKATVALWNRKQSSKPDYSKKRALYRKKRMLSNPDLLREVARRSAQNRRAAKAKVQRIPFSAEQLAARVAFFGGKCWMCGAAATHLDHIKPLAVYGPHMLSNLRPACAPCNWRKNCRWFGVRWAESLRKRP